ncbi:hypothetical protein BKA69DRAFT_1091791 [Paraphysoderma sedebokerense]|nr:hypothetical protein BKA69DRAFT_1091791 [Paraphysoderma sedebokerense]
MISLMNIFTHHDIVCVVMSYLSVEDITNLNLAHSCFSGATKRELMARKVVKHPSFNCIIRYSKPMVSNWPTTPAVLLPKLSDFLSRIELSSMELSTLPGNLNLPHSRDNRITSTDTLLSGSVVLSYSCSESLSFPDELQSHQNLSKPANLTWAKKPILTLPNLVTPGLVVMNHSSDKLSSTNSLPGSVTKLMHNNYKLQSLTTYPQTLTRPNSGKNQLLLTMGFGQPTAKRSDVSFMV